MNVETQFCSLPQFIESTEKKIERTKERRQMEKNTESISKEREPNKTRKHINETLVEHDKGSKRRKLDSKLYTSERRLYRCISIPRFVFYILSASLLLSLYPSLSFPVSLLTICVSNIQIDLIVVNKCAAVVRLAVCRHLDYFFIFFVVLCAAF